MFASIEIGGIEYDLNESELTAEVSANGGNYSGSIVIPSSINYEGAKYSVTSIGSSAFSWCTNMTSITIPNSITSIGYSAFYHCTSLTSVTIPQSVYSVANRAFEGCSSLTTVNWNAQYCPDFGFYNEGPFYDSKITSIIFGEEVTRIPAYFCDNSKTLTSVSISNSEASIGKHAFDGCKNLASITFGEKLQSIEYGAFYGCASLKSLIIPNSAYSIESGAFIGCTNIVSMEGPACAFDVIESMWPNYTSLLQTAKVASGTLTENGFGFINRSHKTLKSLDISATENTTLADEAFKGCYTLEELILPAHLTEFGYMAVADCKHLQSITIPWSVTKIDDSAFEDCRSLAKLEFESESQLKTIGAWAFYNCHNLPQIELPEGVTEIGDAAFYGCVYAESLKLPASVKKIGDNAFALCSKLTRMNVDAVLPPTIVEKTFYEVSRKAPVYVPDESVDLYKGDALWGQMNIVGRSQSPSAIDNTFVDPKAVKRIVNGQILILRGSHTYTLTGQEVR